MSKVIEEPKALPAPIAVLEDQEIQIANPVLSKGRRILIAVCMMLVYFLGVSWGWGWR